MSYLRFHVQSLALSKDLSSDTVIGEYFEGVQVLGSETLLKL